jgi:transposase-like zinc-binding protein
MTPERPSHGRCLQMMRCLRGSRYAERAGRRGRRRAVARISGRIAVRFPWRAVRDTGGMGRPSQEYRPKSPARSALYQIVRDHFETFRAEAAAAHERDGLPRFTEEEFRSFLRCGLLAGGFARFRCDRCGLDRLVPFSCKGRAVCASCGGRRTSERAAHLVDHVFPAVPVRQWVLSLPYRLRYLLAWDHALCRAVTGVFVRALFGSLRRRARRAGPAEGAVGLWRSSSDSAPR